VSQIGTRLLTLEIDATDVTAEVSKSVITSGAADSDFVTFADAAAGGARQYALNIVAAQDTDADTVWDQVWSHAGETVTCIVAPYGNATPSPTQPHYSCSAVITEPDGDLLGGEADESTTAKMTFEVTWPLTGKPTKITA
jgi:hypothetical protein